MSYNKSNTADGYKLLVLNLGPFAASESSRYTG